jgi:hypothetical protein
MDEKQIVSEELEEWREETLASLRRREKDSMESFLKYMEGYKKANQVAMLIVQKTQLPIDFIQVSGIMAEVRVIAGSNQLVHNLAKQLHLTFKKCFCESDGTMSYITKIEGVTVSISSVKDIPHCTVTFKNKRITTRSYQIECHGKIGETDEQKLEAIHN